VSRQFEENIIPTLIGLEAFVLENNRYDFEMESPDRNDILSGVLVSWGKNIETGNYEHSFSVDSQGIYIDGEAISGGGELKLGAKWESVLHQLGENSNANIRAFKSLDTDWIMNQQGAEVMAYNYLLWNCAPLRKAQAKCITPVLRPLDIGSFVSFDLPGYPPKFSQTAWVITGKQDDLDGMVTTFELLEVWNMPVIAPNRFLLLEDDRNIFMETGEKIKLESLNA
jgi:hypothetical protein